MGRGGGGCLATKPLSPGLVQQVTCPCPGLPLPQPRHCPRRDPTIPPEPESRQPEPTAPPGEPEDGEVLYTRVLLTERDGGEYGGWGTRRPRVSPPPAQVPEPVSLPGTSPSRSPGGSPRSAPPQEPPVTYAVLPGPHARLRLPSDTYENVP